MKNKEKLVIGVSSRALFSAEKENVIYSEQGLKAYSDYQKEHEDEILKPGSAFPLIKAFLALNKNNKNRLVEVIIMSKNSADTSLRIFNSLAHYNLDITRAALTGGQSLAPYLKAFEADLFLSANEVDVQEAINNNHAAGVIYTEQLDINPLENIDQIRIAFDGDAVLFTDEAELIYQNEGIDAFAKHEQELAKQPLPKGHFAKFLQTIAEIQSEYPENLVPIRTALVTARNAPAHERVIRTLRAWNVRIDEAFFLGGKTKKDILVAFGAHIFFDDQKVHLDKTALVIPSARVPIKKASD